ncbi:MAG: ATP synthase F1 subunit delta [Saprospiraceae bacterium]|nr:ATP synthase F1 subunit delta [Saprospiraceae bacterium]
MGLQKIASRYARSLIELASSEDKLERVMQDVRTFYKVTKNRDFYLLLKSPIISAEQKIGVVEKLFSKECDILTMEFLKLLIRKGREAYLPEIATEFIGQYRELNGISSVRIRAAASLDKKQVNAIVEKLEEGVLKGRKIEIQEVIDPELVGGFVLEFDNQLYDASIISQLEEMKKEFDENLYISKVIAS